MSELIKDPLMLNLMIGLLFLASLLYSSVGHGGASAYIAILALFNFTPEVIKPLGLLLNIIVSLIAFIHYYRKGHFSFKLFYPFAIASFPASFLGALVPLDNSIYKVVLGVCLFFPILRLLDLLKEENEEITPVKKRYAFLAGFIIGMLSGMLGIGGGILLGPVILFFHWAHMKQTAAVSALFIFVNSISGLLGFVMKGGNIHTDVSWTFTIVLIGALIGGYLGGTKFNKKVLRYILAIVLSVASAKLIMV